MRILVTGGTGFIGTAFVQKLIEHGRDNVRIAVRELRHRVGAGRMEIVRVADLSGETDWGVALTGVDVVVHLAARVHVQREDTATNAEFHRINAEGTCNLARQAAAAGVKRLLFLSSVKIHGEGGARAYRESDPPCPDDAYAASKWEAEQGLREIASRERMEFVIIRPPLVYGPGVKANFRALMRAVEMGIPLPFGAVDNRRSFVALANLTDFMVTCITHPAAAGEAFLVSDGEDLSTVELIRHLARVMGRRARLVSVPPMLLTAAAAMTGRRAFAQRLLASLQVDIAKARQRLDWKPAVTVEEGLRAVVTARADENAA